jgi:hypothetical protein
MRPRADARSRCHAMSVPLIAFPIEPVREMSHDAIPLSVFREVDCSSRQMRACSRVAKPHRAFWKRASDWNSEPGPPALRSVDSCAAFDCNRMRENTNCTHEAFRGDSGSEDNVWLALSDRASCELLIRDQATAWQLGSVEATKSAIAAGLHTSRSTPRRRAH